MKLNGTRFGGASVLYVPEGRRYNLTIFAKIDKVEDYYYFLDFDVIKANVYFSKQEFTEDEEIFYVAPNFFTATELDIMFTQILPEEVDV